MTGVWPLIANNEEWFVDNQGRRVARITNLEPPMTTLKPGDRVLATDISDLPRTVLKRDTVYTVSEVDHLTGRARSTVTLAEVPGLAFDAKRFTLEPQPVPAPDFKAGDIVENIDAQNDDPYPVVGRFYRVLTCIGSRFIIAGSDLTWKSSRFRLAFRPPEGEVWEPWNGGAPPTDGDVAFVVKGCVDGRVRLGQAYRLNWFAETGSSMISPIIAYRVVEQAVSGIDRSAKSFWQPSTIPESSHPGWTVWNPQRGPSTYGHPTEGAANIEAKRLATANPGQTFYVMGPTGKAFVAPIPQVEERAVAVSTGELSDDHIPF